MSKRHAIKTLVIILFILTPMFLFFQNCGSPRFAQYRSGIIKGDDLSANDKALIQVQASQLGLSPDAFASPTIIAPQDSDLMIPVCQYRDLVGAQSCSSGTSTTMMGNLLWPDSRKGTPGENWPEARKTAQANFQTWPDGIIAVQFDAALPAQLRQVFISSAKEWAQVAGVHFVLRKDEKSFLYVKAVQRGSYSTIGFLPQGAEMGLSVTNQASSVAHELGHVLGLIHEMQRSDRDQCIAVDKALETNLNYKIFLGDNSLPYGLDSIMHYSVEEIAPGISNFTVLKSCPRPSDVVGGKKISLLDAQRIAQYYPGTGDVSLDEPTN
jgi:hypothetical protein